MAAGFTSSKKIFCAVKYCTSSLFLALCAAEDDKLSEYSHPSLLDGGWKLSRTNLAGSSLLASPISEDNENDPHRVSYDFIGVKCITVIVIPFNPN